MNTIELKEKLEYFRKNVVGIQLYFLVEKSQKIELPASSVAVILIVSVPACVNSVLSDGS